MEPVSEGSKSRSEMEEEKIPIKTKNKNADSPEPDLVFGDVDNVRPGTFWNVFSFGICLVSTNIFIAWSSGLINGYWDFLVASFFVTVAFVNLMLCIAEMVSILPFSGGMYGFARVTAGPFIGFLVGCCEAIANIIYTVVGTMPVGTTITYIFNSDPKYEPMYWVFSYFSIILSEYLGRKIYFNFLNTYAFVLIMLLVFYLIISFQSIDTDKYISPPEGRVFSGGIADFLSIVPTVGWFYFGFETIPLISDEIRDAKRDTPRGIVATLIFLVICAFIIPFVVYTQYPGLLDDEIMDYFPLNGGFITALGMNDQTASIIALPSLYIANALYIFGYGKQLSALAHSNLLPSFMGWTLPNSKIPYMSLIVGSVLGIFLLFILTHVMKQTYYSVETTAWFNAALLGSYFTFIISFISFIIFRVKYPNLKRSFFNPLGIIGAVIGILSFLLMSVGLVGFSADDHKSFQYFLSFIGICTIYYFVYAKRHQRFSKEEQSVMFIVYLIKANEKKQQQIRTGSVTKRSTNQKSVSISSSNNNLPRDSVRSPPGSRSNSLSLRQSLVAPSEAASPPPPLSTGNSLPEVDRRTHSRPAVGKLFTLPSVSRIIPDDYDILSNSEDIPPHSEAT